MLCSAFVVERNLDRLAGRDVPAEQITAEERVYEAVM